MEIIEKVVSMKSFISEDDIEQAICNRLSQPEYGWTRIVCDPSVEKQDDVGATGRSSVNFPLNFCRFKNIHYLCSYETKNNDETQYISV